LPWFKWTKVREINGKKVTRYQLVLHNFKGRKFYRLDIDYSLWKSKGYQLGSYKVFEEKGNTLGYHWRPADGPFETGKTYRWSIVAGMIKDGKSWDEFVYDGPTSFTIGSKKEGKPPLQEEGKPSFKGINSPFLGKWSWECCQGEYYGTFTLNQKDDKIIGEFIDKKAQMRDKLSAKVNGNSIIIERRFNHGVQTIHLTLNADGKEMNGHIEGSMGTDIDHSIKAKRW